MRAPDLLDEHFDLLVGGACTASRQQGLSVVATAVRWNAIMPLSEPQA